MEEQQGKHGDEGNEQLKDRSQIMPPQKVRGASQPPFLQAYHSPWRLLITIVAAIFTAEVIAMFVVRAIQPIPYYQITLIDAGLMTILIFPVLYFFSFRPLLHQMEKSWQAEEKLRKAFDELELRVQERTEELRLTNIELQEEIAERKRAEIALREAADRFRIVADFTYDWEFWRSPQNHYLYVSPSCERITGYSREAFYEDPDLILHVVHPDDREQLKTHHRDELCSDHAYEIEFRIIRQDGQERWIGHACQLVRGNQGQMLGRRASNRDITERKRTEEALRQSEERYRSLFNSMTEGFAVHEILCDEAGTPCDYRFLEINPSFERLTGRKREALLGRTVKETLTETEAFWIETYGQVALTGRPASFDHYSAALDRYYSVNAYCPTPGQFAVVFTDISERKKSEEALLNARDELEQRVRERTKELLEANQELLSEIHERVEIERQLRVETTALESAANGIIITGQRGNIRWANPAFLRMTGYSLEEVLGKNPRLLKSGQHEPGFYQDLWETILAGNVWRGEIVNRRKDGSLYVEEQTITPLVDENGQLSNFIAIKQDITERKRAENTLQTERTKLRNIMDALPDGVYIVSQNYDVEYINPVIEKAFGGIQGRKCYAYLHDRPDVCPWCRNDVACRGQVVNWEWHSQKTGKTYDLFDTRLVNADGSVSKLKLFHDITHRKQAEVDLEQRNRELRELSATEHKQRQLAETLRASAQALAQTLDIDTVLRTLLKHMRAIVHADTASVALVEGDMLLPVRTVENDSQWIDSDQVFPLKGEGINSSFYQQLISTRSSVVIADTAAEPDWQLHPGMEQIRSWLFAPIRIEEKIIGVVAFGRSAANHFTAEHVQWTEAIVGQAAIAIKNAWLFEQLRAGRERLQTLSRRLVEIQETERRFISRELHDQAGQTLTSLMLGLGALEQSADQPQDVRTRVTELKRLVDSVLEDLHRLAVNLRPASLDHLGLIPALGQLIRSFSQSSTLQIRFKAVGICEDDRLPQDVETTLYRIAQESLTNVVRHAAAQCADIVLERRGNLTRILIEDDGRGFDTEQTQRRLGLLGMAERAEMMGGRLTVESIPGRGTTLVVEVPDASTNLARG